MESRGHQKEMELNNLTRFQCCILLEDNMFLEIEDSYIRLISGVWSQTSGEATKNRLSYQRVRTLITCHE